MSKLSYKIAGLATVALAAIPLIALSTAAKAAEPEVRIAYGDLDLRNPADVATLSNRISVQSDRYCADVDLTVPGTRILMGQAQCAAMVREEAMLELPKAARKAVLANHTQVPPTVDGR